MNQPKNMRTLSERMADESDEAFLDSLVREAYAVAEYKALKEGRIPRAVPPGFCVYRAPWCSKCAIISAK